MLTVGVYCGQFWKPCLCLQSVAVLCYCSVRGIVTVSDVPFMCTAMCWYCDFGGSSFIVKASY